MPTTITCSSSKHLCERSTNRSPWDLIVPCTASHADTHRDSVHTPRDHPFSKAKARSLSSPLSLLPPSLTRLPVRSQLRVQIDTPGAATHCVRWISLAEQNHRCTYRRCRRPYVGEPEQDRETCDSSWTEHTQLPTPVYLPQDAGRPHPEGRDTSYNKTRLLSYQLKNKPEEEKDCGHLSVLTTLWTGGHTTKTNNGHEERNKEGRANGPFASIIEIKKNDFLKKELKHKRFGTVGSGLWHYQPNMSGPRYSTRPELHPAASLVFSLSTRSFEQLKSPPPCRHRILEDEGSHDDPSCVSTLD